MGATHGKLANVFALRPNGFEGTGLNDGVFGVAFSGAASAYYEVEIDAVATPDTFRWRKNGGGWTTGVAITGAAQTLDEGQTITFGATTGHTLGDSWTIGNLKDEACTESGATAQITDATKRLLNPNTTVTFTDSGAANLLSIDYVNGRAHFDANVAVVTVTGNNGYIPESMLEKAGYLYEWGLDQPLDLVNKSVFQDDWKNWEPGQAEASGSAAGFFAGRKWFEVFEDCADNSQPYFFVQFFTYDPDDDQTGDHFIAWVIFENFSLAAPLSEMVKETIGYKAQGLPGFVFNV
jgi:hypothetical protein